MTVRTGTNVKITMPDYMSFGYNTPRQITPGNMIHAIAEESENRATRIEVLANFSLTLDRLAAVFLALSAVTLLVALLPTLLGYWPIMVIAVVHLVIVGWCLRLAWRGNWARQDITVDRDRVVVEYRTAAKAQRHEFATGWVRVEQTILRGEPRVFLVLHEKRTEIGSFVPASERLEAARSIVRALEPHSAWKRNAIEETVSTG